MEKFILADGIALRVSDSGEPAANTSETHANDEAGAAAEAGAEGAKKGSTAMTLVLLHGYLESLEIWEEFAELLTPYMRIITLDLPGHGISEVRGEVHTMEFLADTVHAALGQLGVRRCVVAGHSMGGYAALEFLRKYPDMLAGLVLFHSVPDADTDEKAESRRREIEVVLAGKKDLLAQTAAKSFARMNRGRFAEQISDMADQVFLTEEEGVAALLRGMGERRDNNAAMRESGVPQMMIFGRHDEFIPWEIGEVIAQAQPQARVVWLEESGHIGFVEEREKSAAAILDFCRSLDWDLPKVTA